MLTDCCSPCCPTTETVNVPGVEGPAGTNGLDGIDGVDAFTTTTADFVVPAVGANVTVALVNSTWMVVGQKVVAEGVATFEVVSKPNSASAILKFMGYTDDVAPGTTISAGAQVGPSGTEPSVTGFAASGVNGDISSLVGLVVPLPVSEGGTGASGVAAAAKNLTARNRCLTLFGANANSTADQPLTGLPSRYIITRIIAQNASINLTTCAGGWYSGAAKTGTIIVAAGQIYSALTASSKWVALTLTAVVGTDVLTATTIFFSLTTAQGSAATVDLTVEFIDLTA